MNAPDKYLTARAMTQAMNATMGWFGYRYNDARDESAGAAFEGCCMYCKQRVERPNWQSPSARMDWRFMDCVDCSNKRAARKSDGCRMAYHWDWRKLEWVKL